MQWLKLPAWKVGDPRFELHSGLQVSKKQNVSSPRTRKDSITVNLRDCEVTCSVFWGWWDEWDETALLRSSTLPLGHGGSSQYWIIASERGKTFCFFETWRPEWCLNPRSRWLKTPFIAFPNNGSFYFTHKTNPQCCHASRENIKFTITKADDIKRNHPLLDSYPRDP